MTDYVTIYERVYFDQDGQAVTWERSSDGEIWEHVQHSYDRPPFVLTRPITLPGFVVMETKERPA